MPKVVIINDASVARGGATGLALLQARLLRARGLDVVFASADRGAGAEALRAMGVEVHLAGAQPLTQAPAPVAATRGLYNPAVRRMLARVIAAHDGPDTVYHVHSWSKTLTPAVFAALTPVAPRVFIHAHDFFLACPNGGFMDYRAMRPCDRRGLSAACLATPCDKRSFAQKLWRGTRQAILHRSLPRRAPWGGIVLIHPAMAPRFVAQGYPAERLRVLRNPAEALSPRRIPAETNRGFLFIGRVEAEKGIEDLIAAAQAAKVPLTVVGEGPLRGPLSRAHPQLRFTGWLDRAGILAEAQHARAVVMPSRYPEPFGLVAAEAVLSGLPVILSKTALLAPEIAAEGLGWVCDTRDLARFADLLRRVADLPPEAVRQVSEVGFAAGAGLCLTPDSWCDGLLDLYAGVTGSSGAGSGSARG